MSAKAEIVSLTGLRGLAAFLVVLHHINIAIMPEGSRILLRGQPFVDLFFVLSGFVISMVYIEERIDWRLFFQARLARIYPLHIASAIAMAFAVVCLKLATHSPWPERVSLVEAFREFTLTMAMPFFGTDEIWNYPAWSISVEWWVYFTAFPLIVVLGRRLSIGQLVLLTAALLIGLAAFLLCVPVHFTRGWPAVCRGAFEFLAGYTIYRLGRESSVRINPLLHDLLGLGVLATIYIYPAITGKEGWFVIVLFPVIITGLLHSESNTTKFMRSGILSFFGSISYSLYLLHPLVISGMSAISEHLIHIPKALFFAITVPIAISIATLSYRFFECPARDILRGRGRRKSGPAIAGAIQNAPP